MSTVYSQASAIWLLGTSPDVADPTYLAPEAVAVWLLDGGADTEVDIGASAGAVWLLDGGDDVLAEVVLTPDMPAAERGQSYILMGPDTVFNSGLTQTLLTIGMGGRHVEWGFLQEGTELDTEDLEVITGEDGRAAAIVFRNQRTEVTISAIFLAGTAPPQRGNTITWVNSDGNPITARVLQRRRVYSNVGASVMQITATKWDGLP